MKKSNIVSDELYTSALLGRITKYLIHDLSTPVSSIIGASNILKRKGGDPELLSIIESSTKQISQIIHETNAIINKRSENSTFSIEDIFLRLKSILFTELKHKGIQIFLRVSEPIFLKGNRSLLERSIMNLIVNAIESVNKKSNPKVISLIGTKKDNKIVISVYDTGIGISNKKKVFDNEYTTKHEEGVHGIGLGFVKEAIEENFNGEIKIQSILGKHTEFIIEIPVDQSVND